MEVCVDRRLRVLVRNERGVVTVVGYPRVRGDPQEVAEQLVRKYSDVRALAHLFLSSSLVQFHTSHAERSPRVDEITSEELRLRVAGGLLVFTMREILPPTLPNSAIGKLRIVALHVFSENPLSALRVPSGVRVLPRRVLPKTRSISDLHAWLGKITDARMVSTEVLKMNKRLVVVPLAEELISCAERAEKPILLHYALLPILIPHAMLRRIKWLDVEEYVVAGLSARLSCPSGDMMIIEGKSGGSAITITRRVPVRFGASTWPAFAFIFRVSRRGITIYVYPKCLDHVIEGHFKALRIPARQGRVNVISLARALRKGLLLLESAWHRHYMMALRDLVRVALSMGLVSREDLENEELVSLLAEAEVV